MSREKKGFCFRLHNTGGKSIMAVCDVALLGKKIKFKNIDFDVSSSFYGDSRAGSDEILAKVREADIVNVVGKDIVELLVKNMLVDEKCVLRMGEVPHVQIVRF
jgi:hypothetical protein